MRLILILRDGIATITADNETTMERVQSVCMYMCVCVSACAHDGHELRIYPEVPETQQRGRTDVSKGAVLFN